MYCTLFRPGSVLYLIFVSSDLNSDTPNLVPTSGQEEVFLIVWFQFQTSFQGSEPIHLVQNWAVKNNRTEPVEPQWKRELVTGGPCGNMKLKCLRTTEK